MSWQPPLPSLSTRKINYRSQVSKRIVDVDHVTNRVIVSESGLEAGFTDILRATCSYLHLQEQPAPVTYIGPDGRDVTHTFDAFMTMPDGLRIAFDVKPREFVESSGLRLQHELIEAQVGSAFADRYLIRTEDHIHPDDVLDARTILRARRLPDAAADAAVAHLASGLSGWMRIRELVELTGLRAAAFNAIARLVGARGLAVRDGERILPASFVSRPDTQH
ncbi:hypothetical protein [Antarcticirhabdus aurantiaca]|uniref:Uncharacterized protein n=1 Tax=Antarcticirhabdus aurantiaca TaxID=2606717 RepID=A0ACD4NRK2_9HYPH|nr:hypothetical protein [Antarcticirhabdus aurantiaca]WAJ29431.1 hypothetical protein OXU80_04120 [Jeongeuplla avenae]